MDKIKTYLEVIFVNNIRNEQNICVCSYKNFMTQKKGNKIILVSFARFTLFIDNMLLEERYLDWSRKGEGTL